MSNLGLQILYRILNSRDDVACERYFLPEKEVLQEHVRTHTPLMSVESRRKLADNEIIFVMLSFEMDYDNLLTMLDLGNIKLDKTRRNRKEPLIIIGGPCATFNPLPLTKVADAFVIGEGEDVVGRIMDAAEGDRESVLARLAALPGVYVPGQTPYPQRVWQKDLTRYSHTSAILTPDTEFGKMYIVEVARGCGRHCRFCMAGYCFRRPRPRALADIIRDIEQRPQDAEKIGLMGAAVSDHPEIGELVGYLKDRGIKFSFASLRADTLTKEMAEALAASGQHTLTVAPEAGSVRMRRSINKGIEDEHVFRALEIGLAAGIENFKLYFMVGLPGEEDADVEGILDLTLRIRRRMDELGNRGDLIISVNAFVSKPFTPFQWCGLTPMSVLRKRYRILQKGVQKEKKIKLLLESLNATIMQSFLARGDETAGDYLLESHATGKPLKYLLQEKGLNLEEICLRQYSLEDILPWEFLDMGFSKQYLLDEWQKSLQGVFTPPCFDACRRCGNCK
ncbi:MAG: radical SAM protein [Acidaminococcaceae bacterium]|nr:radical SAM protein [Acidaminococcaceae bacterium]